MSEINYFKVSAWYSGDVAADVDHLHAKRIHLVGTSYIVIGDSLLMCPWYSSKKEWYKKKKERK
jgi:hypothetical protein